MRYAEHEEPRDLVAEMARCDEVAPELGAVKPEQSARSEVRLSDPLDLSAAVY
jgi:hypothetical protein